MFFELHVVIITAVVNSDSLTCLLVDSALRCLSLSPARSLSWHRRGGGVLTCGHSELAAAHAPAMVTTDGRSFDGGAEQNYIGEKTTSLVALPL